jgi:hypothetical protein
MSAIATAVIASGVIGAGVNMHGANKQAKATSAANSANLASQQESERQNWIRYLMTRGITPTADTRTGEVPGAVPGGAMNTKLPLWANVVTQNVPGLATKAKQGTVPFLIKKT